jgi:hypothetical protein
MIRPRYATFGWAQMSITVFSAFGVKRSTVNGLHYRRSRESSVDDRVIGNSSSATWQVNAQAALLPSRALIFEITA